MAIDDHPVEVLRRHFELENASAMPFAGAILTALQAFPHPLPYPLDKLVGRLKEGIGADATHRIRVMLEVCGDESFSHDKRLRSVEAQLDEEQIKQRTEAALELLLDASRRASVTRSLERVKRIGMILANGIVPQVIDGDGTEEMMRIAMELSDRDVVYLGELVKLEGDKVRTSGRLERYDAHTRWEHGPWGTRPAEIWTAPSASSRAMAWYPGWRLQTIKTSWPTFRTGTSFCRRGSGLAIRSPALQRNPMPFRGGSRSDELASGPCS